MTSTSSSAGGSSIPGLGWSTPHFQLGKNKTLAVPMKLHESARAKLVSIMKERHNAKGVVLIQGGDDQNQYDTDTELVFRQDSWFNYLFGTKEPGMYGAVRLSDGSACLFVPKLHDDYRIWCGAIYPPSHFKSAYAVDDVKYCEDIKAYLEEAISADADSKVYILNGVNSDSGSRVKQVTFDGFASFLDAGKVDDSEKLYHSLSTARVTKSPYEVEVMRYCALVASNAHVEVMRSTKAGMVEYELEARFQYEIYKNGGCRKCAYTSICACGPNGAVLHYGHAGAPNDRTLLPTDIALLDMGAEYHGYVSDITCSFPVSGRFTADQKAIYEGVLNAQIAVMNLMKPGCSWPDCHSAAEREIVKALVGVGVLRVPAGETVEDVIRNELGPVFFPHGLGHLIGCDTHDVGGYLEGTPSRSTRPGHRKLRTARVLEAGMTLTNEPGCYFINALIEAALADPVRSKYIDAAVIEERFKTFGGVRLEDVVLVTADGCENLTNCPRTVSEIESVLSGGTWPLEHCPELKRKWTKLAENGLGMTFFEASK